MSKKTYTEPSNRFSRIVSKANRNRTIKTRTDGRDEGTLNVEVTSKNDGKGASRLYIENADGEFMGLNGFEARTIYQTLQRHFRRSGKAW